MKLRKGFSILRYRLTQQGAWVTLLWAIDHAVRILTGAPIRRLSQITPQVYIGGQYRGRGWPRLQRRGITAVINLRVEFDDQSAGIAPPHYSYLPTEDDQPPTLEQLREGVAFIQDEVERGGAVYVHCGAGVGRAATMAAAYLVSTGLSAADAWDRIRQVRPFVRPMPAQLSQLERFDSQGRKVAT
jgi:protein tyrosine phosphatase (PTP) superfamily phosphohydrolase (DUF442 family)